MKGHEAAAFITHSIHVWVIFVYLVASKVSKYSGWTDYRVYSKNKSIILIFILIEVPKFVDMCGWGITLLVSYGTLDIKELVMICDYNCSHDVS